MQQIKDTPSLEQITVKQLKILGKLQLVLKKWEANSNKLYKK